MSKGRKIYNIILIVLIIATLGFIWGHSIPSKQESAAESEGVFNVLSPFFDFIFGKGVIDSSNIRKLAHVGEFFVLEFEFLLLFSSLKGLTYKWILLSFPFGFISACIDETIQIFSNRGALVTDVLIDSIGVLGATLIFIIVKLITDAKRKRKLKS